MHNDAKFAKTNPGPAYRLPGLGEGGAKRRAGAAAFTLVELLVVIAISVILFGLLLGPLVNAFRLTQRAQLITAAQDSARKTLEILSRELGSAVYVYDNNSHPFVNATKPSTTNQNDHFTNFLDLTVPDTNGAPVVMHAYNAKIDIVPVRHSGANNGTSDPTAGDEPVRFQQGFGSAVLSGTGLVFPLGPSSTIVRYMIGLKDPTKPYHNSAEANATGGGGDNTYVFFRAQVPVYNPIDPTTKQPKVINGTIVNENFFAPKLDANGKPTNQPEFDDPDFFRYVDGTKGDVNWLNDTHPVYAGAAQADHNRRVDNWFKAAKQVITAPDIDLIVLPRDRNNQIAYDANGYPATSYIHDPVGNKDYPVIRTTVSFRPAGVTSDASANTTSDFETAGIPANAADANGLPYIPTVFTAASQSWSFPYHVTLYPVHDQLVGGQPKGLAQVDTTKAYFDTYIAANGDIMEREYKTGAGSTPIDVYDLTLQQLVNNAHDCVPMTVNATTGTINFDMPALVDPNNTANPNNRYWQALPVLNPDGSGDYVIDLTDQTTFTNTPLTREGVAPTGPFQVTDAHVVPGSVRVYGPDISAIAANAGSSPNGNPSVYNPQQSVQYTQVSGGDTLGENQFRVDYHDGTVHIAGPSSGSSFTVGGTQTPFPAPFYVTFDYQANLAPTVNSPLDIAPSNDPTTGTLITAVNPAAPMQVKVDYQTRDLIDVNVGVRVYDPSTHNAQAQTVYVNNKVKIGNSNR